MYFSKSPNFTYIYGFYFSIYEFLLKGKHIHMSSKIIGLLPFQYIDSNWISGVGFSASFFLNTGIYRYVLVLNTTKYALVLSPIFIRYLQDCNFKMHHIKLDYRSWKSSTKGPNAIMMSFGFWILQFRILTKIESIIRFGICIPLKMFAWKIS